MNTEIISVPRELLERLERMYMDGMSIYGECEEIRALLAQPNTCTCPSGDGSLRWPCPVHPPEPQAFECFDGGNAWFLSYERLGVERMPLYRHPPAQAPVVLPGREALRDLIAEVIGGDTYDCTRVWSAWGVGTMDQDDFVPFVEQEERLYELADACLDEFKRLNPTL